MLIPVRDRKFDKDLKKMLKRGKNPSKINAGIAKLSN